MNHRALLVVSVGLWGLSPAGISLPALHLEKATAHVEFLATSTPRAINIRGKLRDGVSCSGALVQMGNQLTGSIQVPLDALETGIAMRTSHMKEKYLETERWPWAELNLGSIAIAEADKVPFRGTLKLHGIEKPVSGRVAVWRKGTQLSLSLEFKISMKDFAISNPSFMGVQVAQTVTIQASVSGPVEEINL